MSKVNYIYRDFYIDYTVHISKGCVSIQCTLISPDKILSDNIYKYNEGVSFSASLDEVTFDVERIINKAKHEIDGWYTDNES